MPLYIFNVNSHTQSVKSKYNTEKQKRMDRGHIRLCGSTKALPDRGHHFPTGAMMGSADQPKKLSTIMMRTTATGTQIGAVAPKIPAFAQPTTWPYRRGSIPFPSHLMAKLPQFNLHVHFQAGGERDMDFLVGFFSFLN